MTKYAYFPGCSLEKIASSYHKSSLETTKVFDIELQELEDWNCCVATTYFHVDEIFAHTLVARNLALAEKDGLDLVAPCSACYKNAYFTNKHFKQARVQSHDSTYRHRFGTLPARCGESRIVAFQPVAASQPVSASQPIDTLG